CQHLEWQPACFASHGNWINEGSLILSLFVAHCCVLTTGLLQWKSNYYDVDSIIEQCGCRHTGHNDSNRKRSTLAGNYWSSDVLRSHRGTLRRCGCPWSCASDAQWHGSNHPNSGSRFLYHSSRIFWHSRG